MKKIMASWMIVLIMTIPFYTSVMGASLEVRVSGDRAVDEFRSENDRLNIVAEAKNELQGLGVAVEIKPSNLVYIPSPGEQIEFDSCEPSDNPKHYVCEYFGERDVQLNQQDVIAVRLLDNNGNVVLVKNKNLFVDKKGPRITQMVVSQDVIGVKVGFAVIDDQPSSGLRNVQFRSLSAVNNTEYEDKTFSDSGELRLGRFSSESKNQTYFIAVQDRLGNVTTEERIFFTDFSRPEIFAGPFIIDNTPGSITKGQVINSILPNSEVLVKVNFTDDSISDAKRLKVVENFEDYGGTLTGPDISSVADVFGKNVVEYEWKISNPNPKVNARLKFDVTDSNGNFNPIQINYPLPIEINPPRFVDGSFKVKVNGKEVNALAASTSGDRAGVGFELQLFEPYPGLTEANIRLDASDIGASNDLVADFCEFNSSGIWTCNWFNVQINQVIPGQNFNLKVSDRADNSDIIPILRTLSVDSTPPEIKYFGSLITVVPEQDTAKRVQNVGVVNFKSYLNRTGNVIIAQLEDTGAGVSNSTVMLNNFYGVNSIADRCEQAGTLYTCIWNDSIRDVVAVGEVGIGTETDLKRINLIASDAVGNTVTGQEFLFVDLEKPKIKSVGVFSFEESGKGRRDFHLGFDQLQFVTVIEDASPPEIAVDLRNLGLINFQFQRNNEQPCTEIEQGLWNCELLTNQILDEGGDRDGYNIQILARDALGLRKNDLTSLQVPEFTEDNLTGVRIVSKDGKDRLNLEVAKSDKRPEALDFWEIDNVRTVPEKIDKEISELTDQRVYFDVAFNEIGGSNPEIVEVNLIDRSCVFTEGPGFGPRGRITDVGIMNNNGKDKSNPFLFVDFARGRVDFDRMELTCNIAVKTAFDIGKTRFIIPKPQILNVTMPFEFFNVPIGELDQTLQDKVDDIRGGWIGPDSGFAKTIDILNKVANLAKGLCTVIKLLYDILVMYNIIANGFEPLHYVPDPTGASKATAISSCIASDLAGASVQQAYNVIKPFCMFMSCQYGLGGLFGEDSTIGKGIQWTAQAGDYASGANAASSLNIGLDPFKSLPLAIIMACIPGIVSGFEKYRQVECMYVDCLENQIPDGLTTVEECHNLHHYLECKYVYGDLFNMIPWVQIYDFVINFLRTILSSPLALVGAALSLTCISLCAFTNIGHGTCQIYFFAQMMIDLYSDLDRIFQFSGGSDREVGAGFKSLFGPSNDYCKTLEDSG